MKQTKLEISLREKFEKYKLLPNQVEPIIKHFRKTKDDLIAIDQAVRFKEINEGKKVRDFKFVYMNDCEKKRGVYKIVFDDGKKFYIGRAKYIQARFKAHWREFNKFFTTGEYIPEHYLSKVFEHLKENQWAYYFEITLLEECYTVDELQAKEQKWLDKYKGHPNCLNVGFVARKPVNEIDETPEEMWDRKANTGVARRGGRFVFYPKKKIESSVVTARENSFLKSTPDKKKAATEYSFNVPELFSDKGPCVYKLFYGDRFIINKGKTLAGSVFLLQKGLGYYLAYDHHKESKMDKDYWFKFYDFVRRNPGKEFKVEILFESNDGFEILKAEQVALNESMSNKKCYNNNITGYIPTLNQKTGMHGWITTDQVAQFYEFLSNS